ncbi:hypothetical protein [Streptomyces sp. H27-D2]|uniref:hypothetical protein n=1 Tax=Streptomyces sp. H27-D2 TaxID=3046304 RepID=UPI002DBE2708|nr:hypothetical protein [Streptomyces sp. H27-D2]MEC4014872.1 hypothetical protein [Streptomyces sp. H27-D2]
MNHDTPVSPRPLRHLADAQRRVLTAHQLREHGVAAATVAERCRPGGLWQQVLPGVYLLHAGPPTDEERLHAALLYAGRPVAVRGARPTAVPEQACPLRAGANGWPQGARATVPAPGDPYGEAMITGLAALALHRFSSAPPLHALDRIDVLVPRTRRLRSTALVRLVRAPALPLPATIDEVPVAPAPRALADALAQLADASVVRRLLTEAVRGGHCEPAAVVRALSQARLLSRPHVIDAVDSLLAEGLAIAEGRLYELVREHGLPEPVWNVDLRLPGGPYLGGLDAYWPDQAVAVEIDARTPRQDEDVLWSEYARKREHLERLGVTVVHVTPKKLREAAEQQATVIRTALIASAEREPAAYLVVLPR